VTLTRVHPSPTERNAAIVVQFQLGAGTPRTRALARVLGILVSAPFFAALRTREQLGYVVAGGASEGAVTSLVFRVQSSVAGVETLGSRLDAFLVDFRGALAAMSDAAVAETARIARDRALEPDKTQGEECGRLWAGIEAGAADWTRGAAAAAALETVTVADLLAVWDARVAPGAPRARRATCRVVAQPSAAGGAVGGAAATPADATSAVPAPAPSEVPDEALLAWKAAADDGEWLPASDWF
jgi:insulysin